MNAQKLNHSERRQERKRWDGLVRQILGDCLSDQVLNNLLANCLIAAVGRRALRRPWHRGVKGEMTLAYCDWQFARHHENWTRFLETVFDADFSEADLAELRDQIARLGFKARGDKFASPQARKRAFERWSAVMTWSTQTPTARVAKAA